MHKEGELIRTQYAGVRLIGNTDIMFSRLSPSGGFCDFLRFLPPTITALVFINYLHDLAAT